MRAIYLPFVALGVQAWALRGDDGSHRLGLMALSFVLLFAFTWQNRKHRPMLLLLAGLLLNMAPMLLHNGYMPITPETLATLFPSAPENWPLGLVRPGSKDIVASAADSPLWFLGDVFALASPFPMPTAFSIGDLVIMGGYLWSAIHFTGQTTSLPVTAK
ncbi:MAG: DUF5317 domain-containing protein [Chloroflexi bacterium]|nr:DUF5317 domain-containing protein [Chloroflexota bacterium]